MRRYWPAEWDPHEATWLAWPWNPETWPGDRAKVSDEWLGIVRALVGRETIRILVRDDTSAQAAARALDAIGIGERHGVELHFIPNDDAWLRDTGPVFVIDHEPKPRLVGIDFDFNAWGGKYPPWDLDAAVARKICEQTGIPTTRAGFVLEGGSVEGNGAGSVLTTEACLLNPNRGADRSRESMQEHLREWLGAEQVIWLGEGVEGDDTDGHIDDIARFVSERTIAVASPMHAEDPNAPVLTDAQDRLAKARDLRGRPFEIVKLPSPPRHRIQDVVCPASYANFYLANGAVLVPTFGAKSDAIACGVLAELLPDREVLAVPCGHLVQGFGAVHCLTQQQPRVAFP